jgi:hypothetical protein
MNNRFGPYNPSDRERLELERYESLMNFLGLGRQQPTGVPDPRRFAPPASAANANYPSSGLLGEGRSASSFPFQHSNRNKDGTWEAPLADRDNILGTSVDPHEPQWPRWKKTPPPHREGDFVSDDPFYDIDEISGKAEFYPPGRPLRDGNVDGNPARRQRVDDLPAGNSWRRRLLVARGDDIRGNVQLAADADPKGPPAAPPSAAGEIDMEPPGFRRLEWRPGLYWFTTTEPSWLIDAQGRPRPVPPGDGVVSPDDWPPPNGDNIPDRYQPGSPSFMGERLIRPKVV